MAVDDWGIEISPLDRDHKLSWNTNMFITRLRLYGPWVVGRKCL